jgi:hypothetical protein
MFGHIAPLTKRNSNMHARLSTLALLVSFVGMLALLGACKQSGTDGTSTTTDGAATNSGPDSAPANDERAATGDEWEQPDDHRVASFAGMVATKPATWIEHPPVQRGMEQTRFAVPGRNDSSAAEIVVFYFGPNQGGPLQANIDRWKGQFRPNEDGSPVDADVSEMTSDGDLAITLVEIFGDYMRMGAAFYSPKQHFITAIVEGPIGQVFIRFVGDEATVTPNREAFLEMITSLREDPDA